MHAHGWTAVIVASLLAWAAVPEPDTLLTVPQADSWRFPTSPAPASVSADGRYIALSSYARLVPADTDARADIYVLDRASGAVTLESLIADGRPLSGDNSFPRLSGDGRSLVFDTVVVTADGRLDTDIVFRDRVHDTATSVSRDRSSAPAASRDPAISDDGRVVVFASASTTLVAGTDENGAGEDVYTFDPTTRTITRISVDDHGVQPRAGASFSPSISGDGRYVAFTSTASFDGRVAPPVAGANASLRAQVYVRDTRLGTTTLVSAGAAGAPANGPSDHPSISRDGRYVAFVSQATMLVRHDRNRSADVFVRDLLDQSTTLISRSAGGGTGNGASASPAISADGRFVAFQSTASDLVCARHCAAAADDINLLPDVFLFDRVTNQMTWISATAAGGWAEESGAPQVDASGTVVTFSSRHPIDASDVGNDFDLFVRIPGGLGTESASIGSR
jgi:Tol biopolymer transport system component